MSNNPVDIKIALVGADLNEVKARQSKSNQRGFQAGEARFVAKQLKAVDFAVRDNEMLSNEDMLISKLSQLSNNTDRTHRKFLGYTLTNRKKYEDNTFSVNLELKRDSGSALSLLKRIVLLKPSLNQIRNHDIITSPSVQEIIDKFEGSSIEVSVRDGVSENFNSYLNEGRVWRRSICSASLIGGYALVHFNHAVSASLVALVATYISVITAHEEHISFGGENLSFKLDFTKVAEPAKPTDIELTRAATASGKPIADLPFKLN